MTHKERGGHCFWCLVWLEHWVCVSAPYLARMTFFKCDWTLIKVLTLCMCVNLINDWQRSPTALLMCSDQCYKQGVKGLPGTSPLNDWPLVRVDGWKCSNINDQVPRRPVTRWNEQRSLQPPTTINRPEPVCQPFVITYSTCGPLPNTFWSCLSIFTQCSLRWFKKNNAVVNGTTFVLISGCVLCF